MEEMPDKFQMLSINTSNTAISVLPYLCTPWGRVLLEKVTGSQLFKKFPTIMEPKDSLPHLQVLASCPYPEPDQSSYCTCNKS